MPISFAELMDFVTEIAQDDPCSVVIIDDDRCEGHRCGTYEGEHIPCARHGRLGDRARKLLGWEAYCPSCGRRRRPTAHPEREQHEACVHCGSTMPAEPVK